MEMIKPSLKVTRFSDKDVIATSGVSPIVGPHLILSNIGDGNLSNNTLKLIKDGESVEIIKSNYDDWGKTAILGDVLVKVRTNFDDSSITGTTRFYYSSDSEDYTTISRMFFDTSDNSQADGLYKYDYDESYFYKTN